MTQPLRILVVEDSEDDTELLLHELRRGNYEPTHLRVETAQDMGNALQTSNWDVVVSDFSMPHFNAFAVLELLHSTQKDIPFIVVSGAIGEDRAITAMKLGAHDYILKGHMKRLVPAVERELREAKVRKERHQAAETIRRLAYTDLVTGLPNRVRFQELVHESVLAGQRENYPVSLLIMDLEHFKEVNDTLGHNSGDKLLRQVGQSLRNALLTSGVVARLGGDEFGILLPQLGAAQDVQLAIRKIQQCFSTPLMIDNIPIVVEASIGVATSPNHADNGELLFQQADIAMYRAKRRASGYAVYSPEYNLHSPEKLGLMAELRDAIEQDQLLLHFQPKVGLKDNRIIGSEALVRWQHPRHGLLSPDKFIGAAEQTGLIKPLTRWVLLEALTHCEVARAAGVRLPASVNLSARSLHDPQLPRMIEEVLAATGAQPDQLMLEVTESAIVLDPIRAEENLLTLSSMGVSLSIDDFGTGYTSLSSIKRLPVKEIKIDKSFVTHMLADEKDAMIVRAVIDLGHNLGLSVIAEGVETQGVLDALSDQGCDEIQGFFISEPQAWGPMKTWYSNSSYQL